jgi:dTDP-4-dehydrorhamnose 3,5-epimerase
MKIIETDLPGCVVLEPQVFSDSRGFFFESFNTDKLATHGLQPRFVQGNVSSSAQGVLRGVLSAENKRHFWIPEGFAHGFVVLSERAVFTYLCTATYDAKADAVVRWDDPALAIDWPVSNPRLSDKDTRAPLLSDIAEDRLPVYMA